MKKTSKVYSGDQVVAILEDIKDQFNAFGEGLGVVSDGQERLEKRFNRLEKKVEEIDIRLISVQGDVIEIKHKLSEKVDLADFQKLEKRMIKLEKLVLATR